LKLNPPMADRAMRENALGRTQKAGAEGETNPQVLWGPGARMAFREGAPTLKKRPQGREREQGLRGEKKKNLKGWERFIRKGGVTKGEQGLNCQGMGWL